MIIDLPDILTPFVHRNYRLYFFGQLVSLIGTFMTFTALAWVVYALTRSPLMLGLYTLAGQAPTLAVTPWAGVWVDRLNRKRLLIVTQGLALAQSVALAFLAFSHALNLWAVIALAAFQGVVNAFDLPTRQAMVTQIVEEREHLPAVIGMNSTMFNLGRMLGPPLGGLVLAGFGPGSCFLIDAFSYLAVLAAIWMMRIRPNVPPSTPSAVLDDLKQGLVYALRTGPIRVMMITLGWVSLFGFSYASMYAAFARDVFGGDAHVLGWLMASSALGSICGALLAASRKTIRSLVRGMLLGISLLVAGMIAFALASQVWFAMASLLVTGVGGVTFVTSSNSLVQNVVAESKRGRVLSWYFLCFQAGFPIGSLLIGALASRVGMRASVGLWAGLTAAVVIYLWRALPDLVRRAGELACIQAGPQPVPVQTK